MPGTRPGMTSFVSRIFEPHLSDTNGTADPGTMVVGKTPFQRSA
jgi:hypothetical protein